MNIILQEEIGGGEDVKPWQSTFVKFDIRTVLERGEKLLGSAGTWKNHYKQMLGDTNSMSPFTGATDPISSEFKYNFTSRQEVYKRVSLSVCLSVCPKKLRRRLSETKCQI